MTLSRCSPGARDSGQVIHLCAEDRINRSSPMPVPIRTLSPFAHKLPSQHLRYKSTLNQAVMAKHILRFSIQPPREVRVAPEARKASSSRLDKLVLQACSNDIDQAERLKIEHLECASTSIVEYTGLISTPYSPPRRIRRGYGCFAANTIDRCDGLTAYRRYGESFLP